MHDRIRTQCCCQHQRNRAPGLTCFCLPGGKWQQGAREALGNGNGHMRDDREFRGQMEKVMAQEIKKNPP